MKLWKRVVGAIKDKNSIVVVYVSGRNSFRNSDLEAAIIKATSHDEYHIDKRNVRVVFSWIRASPVSLGPIIWALSRRMEKTRSWVVAIKGLMLMHGVFHCNVPVVRMIQRLPFDLSTFSDGHSKPSKSWGFNSIIREYFAFLDQKAAISFEQDNGKNNSREGDEQLLRLQKWQSLLDLLLQIKPRAENMKVRLILEAMDCVIIEIFDVYGIICSEIAKVSLRIYSISKHEAPLALKVLKKATKQGEELSLFFEFCKEYGVQNACEFPTVTRIPEQDLEELKSIINGVSVSDKGLMNNNECFMEMATVLEEDTKGSLKTIITDKWVVFDEENISSNEQQYGLCNEIKTVAAGGDAAEDVPTNSCTR
ncbi:hypothetical protein like AT1G25240 [Hibiscus trionum]|uniref:ENTH domain-containing protein n=1 Tax=Hibiscus trionum TaxID=183268 RepID=A0A9W7JDW6_HIBTR|nr:hypothetical protein like AT1G25240 [Hibiscus trionum]